VFCAFYGLFFENPKRAKFAWNGRFWLIAAFLGGKKFPAFSSFCANFSYRFPAFSSFVFCGKCVITHHPIPLKYFTFFLLIANIFSITLHPPTR
jgi:prepilin signal peptidase PulO-like enzyme (type II secretory pathway)